MSNILFFGHKQVSHALDTFFDGCINVFGKPNVYEYPILEKHHGASDYKSSEQHTDIQPVYGWWCRNSIPFVEEFSIFEWAQKINNLEIKYIVGTNRAIENFIELLNFIKDDVLENICIIFIEEEEDHDFLIHYNCIRLLKNIYYKIDIHYKVDFIYSKVDNLQKIYPFYISCPNKILLEVKKIKKFSERNIDVCFLTESNHPNRIEYYNLIKNINGNNIILCGKHKFSLNEYFNIINDSKIFISVRGNGWSNTRNIEGPMLGAALFTDTLDITIPFNYIDNESAIFFNKNTLLPRLLEYIDDKNKLEILAKNSHNHCINYHTTVKRAEQMIALSKNIKKW